MAFRDTLHLHSGTHTDTRSLESARRSTRGDWGCSPLYAWGQWLRSGSRPAFWARAGWEGGWPAGWRGGRQGGADRAG